MRAFLLGLAPLICGGTCPLGFWCDDSVGGAPTACAQGTAGLSSNLSSPQDCTSCEPGFYCAAASTSTRSAPCPPGHFCASRSQPLLRARAGFFVDSNKSRELPCEPGSYCVNGVSIFCAAGTYGLEPALVNAGCSGRCPAGHYCPIGTATPQVCGGAHFYCPLGSTAPQPVAPGFYSVASMSDSDDYVSTFLRPRAPSLGGGGVRTQSNEKKSPAEPAPPFHCAAAWVDAAEAFELAALGFSAEDDTTQVDVARSAVNSRTQSAVRQCPPGTTCVDGVARACPAGRWSGAAGESLAACSPCFAGFYCPSGSIRPTQRLCGNESFYCNSGASEPARVPTGYMSANGLGASTAPVPLACGDDNATTADLSSAPSAIAAGILRPFVKPESVLARVPCGLPRAPESSISVTAAFLRSRACAGGVLGGPRTRSQAVECPRGSYCVDGLVYACPAGSAGLLMGETRPSCAARCAEGYACAAGTTSATPAAGACRDPSFYCPEGTGSPQPVLPGFFSLPEAALSPESPPPVKTGVAACTPGNFCVNGLREKCGAGFLGISSGLSTSSCDGPCPAHFYCPAATTVPLPCGGPSVYCPRGSAAPLPVPSGFFSIGEIPRVGEMLFSVTRDDVRECPRGSTCSGGVAAPCPGGTFGDRARETRPRCAGDCAPGHFCPPASTVATAYRCGDAFVALVDLLSSVPAQAALSAAPVDADFVPQVDPTFSATKLWSLYSALTAAGSRSTHDDESVSAAHIVALALPTLTALSDDDANALALSALGVAGGPSAGAAAVAGGLWLHYSAGMMRLDTVLSPAALDENVTSLLFAAAARSPAPVLADTSYQLFRSHYAPGGASAPASSLTLAVKKTAGGWLNASVSIPWRGGVRFRLPAAQVPVESFAAAHRALLSGGPSSIFCPAGTAWPLAVPLGHTSVTTSRARDAALAAAAGAYNALVTLNLNATRMSNSSVLERYRNRTDASVAYDPLSDADVANMTDDDPYGIRNGYGGEYDSYDDPTKQLRVPSPAPTAAPRSLLNVTAALEAAKVIQGTNGSGATPPSTLIELVAEALAAVDRNLTRDATVPSERGWYALSGVTHPCAPGTYSGKAGGFSRHCTVCPAGFACPEGSAEPSPCGAGQFAPSGSPACEQCPGDAEDTVAAVSAREAARQWPLFSGGEAGLKGLPVAEEGLACKTSRACCF